MYNLDPVFNMEFEIYVGKWGEIYETLKRRVNICCLQEVRWKGQGAKMIGNFLNFFGVGVVKPQTMWV